MVSNKKRNKAAPGSEARLVYLGSSQKEPCIFQTNECWANIEGNVISIYFTEKEVNIFNRICELSGIPEVWEDPEEPFYNFVLKDKEFPKTLVEFDGIFTIEIKGVWYTEHSAGISAKLLNYEIINDYSPEVSTESLDEIIPADID